MPENRLIETDCGIIGAGFAGCSAALELADAGKKVDIFIKGNGNSVLTAGGLAAVPREIPDGDSFTIHTKETLEAGNGLNDKKIVKFCVEHFFDDVIDWLIKQGVEFDKAGKRFDLHREGGHSKNRIFHVKDTTGVSIMEVLGRRIREHPNIRVHEDHVAIDLIKRNNRCAGLYVYDTKEDYVKTIVCKAVFVATGGIGKIFSYTSNSDVATGDGIAMCYRAGLPLANMEFIQFHPSVFYDASATNEFGRRFLLTEALRGEGAILKLDKDSKEDFVLQYHPSGSKATRDVVTRAEDIEMRKRGLAHVWLDCTKISKERLQKDFSNAYQFCLSKGIDMAIEPVPVVYAEHYSNGGVLVDIRGATELENCYVIGEAAYTGLHGATRLASNSAPECILFGRFAAKHFLGKKAVSIKNIPLWDAGKAKESKDKTTVAYYWDTIRRTMTTLCGISRNKERLTAAQEVLTAIKKNINKVYWGYTVNKGFLELRNIADVARAVVDGALAREETRACHFREDFPETDKKFLGLTIIRKNKDPEIHHGR